MRFDANTDKPLILLAMDFKTLLVDWLKKVKLKIWKDAIDKYSDYPNKRKRPGKAHQSTVIQLEGKGRESSSLVLKAQYPLQRISRINMEIGIMIRNGICLLLLFGPILTFANSTACDGITGGIYPEGKCRMFEISKLKVDQTKIDEAIKAELRNCKPLLYGYDYEAALRNYMKIEELRTIFIRASCDIVADTFGPGVNKANASFNCEIEMREKELEQSKKLWVDLEMTHAWLLSVSTSKGDHSPSIVCH